MAGGGYLLQRGVLNRTFGKDILPPLLVTFGLSIIIQNVLLELFAADARSLKAGRLETQSIRLAADLAIGTLPLITFAVALACTFGLEYLFNRTGLGRSFRATSDDPEAAQLQGIDHRRIYALATALAFALVAIAGMFLALRINVTPSDGPGYLLYAFEAVIIGGLGSFWGTFAGAMILGVAQGIGFRWDPGWGVLIGHLTFLVILSCGRRASFQKHEIEWPIFRSNVPRTPVVSRHPLPYCSCWCWRRCHSRLIRARSGCSSNSPASLRWRKCGTCLPVTADSSQSGNKDFLASAVMRCSSSPTSGSLIRLSACPWLDWWPR